MQIAYFAKLHFPPMFIVITQILTKRMVMTMVFIWSSPQIELYRMVTSLAIWLLQRFALVSVKANGNLKNLT